MPGSVKFWPYGRPLGGNQVVISEVAVTQESRQPTVAICFALRHVGT